MDDAQGWGIDKDLANTFHYCPKVLSSFMESAPELSIGRRAQAADLRIKGGVVVGGWVGHFGELWCGDVYRA